MCLVDLHQVGIDGRGDIKDGANWSCPADDTRLLQIGESGRQAGVIE